MRALATVPQMLLFDEPTSALDPTMVGEVESVIRRVAGEGTTELKIDNCELCIVNYELCIVNCEL